MASIIQTRNLKKYYGRQRGIEEIRLDVQEGEIFGFIGPNGAGKSTLIRVLLGLIKKTSGDARIFGLEVGPSKTDILDRIGYLPSESSLYTDLKVKELVSLSSRVKKTRNKRYIDDLYERLQLDPNRKIEDLSLGNRKKVSIVCALQNKPDLLILDEPTSGLDPLIQHEFWSCIKEHQQQGATIFLSSHVLTEIQQNCNRAAFIRDGLIIPSDQLDNLHNSTMRRVVLLSDAPTEELMSLEKLFLPNVVSNEVDITPPTSPYSAKAALPITDTADTKAVAVANDAVQSKEKTEVFEPQDTLEGMDTTSESEAALTGENLEQGAQDTPDLVDTTVDETLASDSSANDSATSNASVTEAPDQQFKQEKKQDQPLEQMEPTPSTSKILEIHPINGGVQFLFEGNIQDLLVPINQFPIRDLRISEPDLEEIFLTWYGESSSEKKSNRKGGKRQ